MGGVKIAGLGKAVPEYVMTNEKLSEYVDTSDEWIKSRTGIETRYLSTGETTTDLAIRAAAEAIKNAKLEAEQIDMIIVATISPDFVMPSTACKVQAALGMTNATAFDISAACSGFVYGARLAVDSIKSGSSQHVLVIGAEVLSKTVDWSDRTTCVLFGDGAGAAIFSVHHKNNILGLYTRSSGLGGDALTLEGRTVQNCIVKNPQESNYMAMNGQEVYRFATTVVPKTINLLLEKENMSANQVDWFVLHQANSRIMDSVAKKIGVHTDKFFKNLERYGNTSAASIPIALYDLAPQLKSNDIIMLVGFGGGLTWGSVMLLWE
ncbi:MAG: beta-ketoacyl-ACP synthase III [Cellulosilyticaceae bacterium]